MMQQYSGNNKRFATLLVAAVFLFASLGVSQGSVQAQGLRFDGSRFSEGARIVPAAASTTIPTAISPSGSITNTTPTYKWTRVSGATQYKYTIYKGSTIVYTKTLASGSCGSSTTYCSNTPTTFLSSGSYTWRVRASIGGVWKSYSPSMAFTVTTTAFDSEFTTNASGWTPVHGAWSVNAGDYWAVEDPLFWASSKHSNTYGTMTFEASLEDYCLDWCISGLVFNGTPAPLGAGGQWKNGYEFFIQNGGTYFIQEYLNGSLKTIKPATTYSGINDPDNVMKVTYNATTGFTQFYINGKRVATYTLTDIRSGQVGLMYFHKGPREDYSLDVDYAKLSLTAPSK
jgi:hypothetical protein